MWVHLVILSFLVTSLPLQATAKPEARFEFSDLVNTAYIDPSKEIELAATLVWVGSGTFLQSPSCPDALPVCARFDEAWRDRSSAAVVTLIDGLRRPPPSSDSDAPDSMDTAPYSTAEVVLRGRLLRNLAYRQKPVLHARNGRPDPLQIGFCAKSPQWFVISSVVACTVIKN